MFKNKGRKANLFTFLLNFFFLNCKIEVSLDELWELRIETRNVRGKKKNLLNFLKILKFVVVNTLTNKRYWNGIKFSSCYFHCGVWYSSADRIPDRIHSMSQKFKGKHVLTGYANQCHNIRNNNRNF